MSSAAPASTAAALVAVIGNPNTGKSSLFNALTGINQQVGNYPGITVERREGTCRLEEGEVTLIDLPGTYSLAAMSADEQVIIDVLSGRRGEIPAPAAVLCVVDASNLRRNLFLVSQVAETGLPVVVALNMIDEARERGLKLDVAALSARLGVPVVPTVAVRGEGLTELRRAIAGALSTRTRFAPVAWPPAVVEARGIVAEAARQASRTFNEADLSRLVFDVEPSLAFPGLVEARSRAHKVLEAASLDPVSAEAFLRFRHLDGLVGDSGRPAETPASARPYAIDRLFTHRVGGLLIFGIFMFLVFASVYWIARPAMDGIQWVFGKMGVWAQASLAGHPMLEKLVVNGIIKGVGGVIVFLPQILILFLFVAILEDSGYMARAAFLMDKVFSWTGLNGKSFVPMLSSFACAVPAIMTTRTIEDPKARLSTILVAPLMSCSARLPVYVLMIGAFIEPKYGPLWAGAALFAMHMLGLVVAIPVAFLINRFILRLRPLPFILEMPPYRMPRTRSVGRRMFLSGREFVLRAGTVIFAFSIVIWALSYFPHPAALAAEVEKALPAGRTEAERDRAVNSAYLEQSLLGRFGKAVQPLFAPAGFDWKTTVAVPAAFPAREVVVSTLGILFSAEEGEDSALKSQMMEAKWPDGRAVYGPAMAAAVMVFFAFCLQCGSTVAVMAREASWKWAGFAFFYMTTLAWIGAVATYQIAR
ncbi:MAG: ferrous iron transport protein B [Planctomycetes bacterium]|nr:ferrous iron transport protein B [Planctomycetota bacterium]